MPRRYRPQKDDYFFMAAVYPIYGMLRPIEKKLKQGGYTGPTLADFDNNIYIDQNIDKTNPLDFSERPFNAGLEAVGAMAMDDGFKVISTLSRDEETQFRRYLKKFDDYLGLLIKNTSPEEYPEEVSELKFYKAYLRMIKVFGSRELVQDQLGFLVNARAYDADFQNIVEVGAKKTPDKTRELWRLVKKNYPITEYRDSMIDLINLACDYEENKEKNTYIEQIEYRENYRKALQNYWSANNAQEMGIKEAERIAKLYALDEVIKDKKQADGPDKDVDYYGIMKRVEEQEKNKQPVDPKDKELVDSIKESAKNVYNANPARFDYCNARYMYELEAVGFHTNGKNVTGIRGNQFYYPEIDAQINAMDMGWPVDELVHVQRLQLILRPTFKVPGKSNDPAVPAFKNRCKTFYEERIMNKPYPSTEEGRQAFYRDFYALAQEATNIISAETMNNDDEAGELAHTQWDIFEKEIKKTMDKPLTFAQKMVLSHVQDDVDPALTSASVRSIKDSIGAKRLGHGNSSEYDKLRKAYKRFEEAFNANKNAFKVGPDHNLSPEALKLLKDVKAASKAYLKEKDKDKKTPDQRSNLGKNRYEGATKAYHLVSRIIKKHEEKLEVEAKARKEAERVKGRRIVKEAFFKTGTEEDRISKEFDIKKAGGEDKYNELIETEKRLIAEEKLKEPETDAEKYEKLIDGCRVKKDEPVAYEDAEENEAVQNGRIDNLALMLAAKEFQEERKPYNLYDIMKRSEELKDIYSLDGLKKVSPKLNGPEELKHALTYDFRAVELKKKIEESLYEVGKADYRNIYESQLK